MKPNDLFVVCAPGLEPWLNQELQSLGLAPAGAAALQSTGGVALPGGLETLYRANLHLRTATRILERAGQFHALGFPELRRKASQIPWERYLQPGQPVTFRVTCHKSKLYHSDAVAERLAAAIADRLGQPAAHTVAADEDSGSEQLILARLVHDECMLSVDSSGDSLHRRGYRQATAKAPLRETLAAALLLASGWDQRTPLVDPFCGSGTIPIEAALLASQSAPGRARRFAFMEWPTFDSRLWRTTLAAAEARRQPLPAAIVGADRDAGAVTAAQANAARAEMAITLLHQAVSASTPPDGQPGPGWVVSNLPYGIRLSGHADLRNVYARFGQILRERFGGWQVGLLLGDERLQASLNLPFDEGRSRWLVNGGLKVKWVRARVPGPKASADR